MNNDKSFAPGDIIEVFSAEGKRFQTVITSYIYYDHEKQQSYYNYNEFIMEGNLHTYRMSLDSQFFQTAKLIGGPRHKTQNRCIPIDPKNLTVGEAYELMIDGRYWNEGHVLSEKHIQELSEDRRAGFVRACQPAISSLRPGDVIETQRDNERIERSTLRAPGPNHNGDTETSIWFCYQDKTEPRSGWDRLNILTEPYVNWRLVYRATTKPEKKEAPMKTKKFDYSLLQPGDEFMFNSASGLVYRYVGRDGWAYDMFGNIKSAYEANQVDDYQESRWHTPKEKQKYSEAQVKKCGHIVADREKSPIYAMDPENTVIPWDGKDLSIFRPGVRIHMKSGAQYLVKTSVDPKTLQMTIQDCGSNELETYQFFDGFRHYTSTKESREQLVANRSWTLIQGSIKKNPCNCASQITGKVEHQSWCRSK